MKVLLSFLTIILLVSCAHLNTYKLVDDLKTLEVKFGFHKWNGIVIPPEGISIKCGGQGISPDFYVSNIPKKANAILLEYEDSYYKKLGYSVSNGAYWISTEGKTEIYIPSIVEGQKELPEGIFDEEINPGNNLFHQVSGVYIAPNSCRFTNKGSGHRYFVHVKAVYKPYDKEDQGLLLGYAVLELGIF